jgi:hypothetical protein
METFVILLFVLMLVVYFIPCSSKTEKFREYHYADFPRILNYRKYCNDNDSLNEENINYTNNYYSNDFDSDYVIPPHLLTNNK